MKVAKNVFWLLVAFFAALAWLWYLTTLLNEVAGVSITFPSNLDKLKELSGELQEVKESHFSLLLILFCSAYLYKQTFAIPGSVLM